MDVRETKDFSLAYKTCTQHKHSIPSDMKVEIKILTNFIFIIFLIVHVVAKDFMKYLFLCFTRFYSHNITLLILKFFYLKV